MIQLCSRESKLTSPIARFDVTLEHSITGLQVSRSSRDSISALLRRPHRETSASRDMCGTISPGSQVEAWSPSRAETPPVVMEAKAREALSIAEELLVDSPGSMHGEDGTTREQEGSPLVADFQAESHSSSGDRNLAGGPHTSIQGEDLVRQIFAKFCHKEENTEEFLLKKGYTIERHLGGGTYGQVYLARRGDHGRVAIKLLDKSMLYQYENSRDAILREKHTLELVSKYNLPYLVPLLESFANRDYVFFVTVSDLFVTPGFH